MGDGGSRPAGRSYWVRQVVVTVLAIAVGMYAARLAEDSVSESAGYWGSLGIGILVGGAVAALLLTLVRYTQGRRGPDA